MPSSATTGRPVGTLQGTDRSRVALLGSLSKTLSPALGIGWMATPPAWTGALRASTGAQPGSSTLDQLTFASFLQSGAYDRHLRAARKRYRPRRDRLVQALAERLPGPASYGRRAPPAGPARRHRRPRRRGRPGRGRRPAGRRPGHLPPPRRRHRPGLVLGYGNLAGGQVDEAVALLAAAVADSRRML